MAGGSKKFNAEDKKMGSQKNNVYKGGGFNKEMRWVDKNSWLQCRQKGFLISNNIFLTVFQS